MRAVILETISRGRFSGITDLSVSDSNPIFSAMLNDFHFVVELIGTLHSSDLRSWPKWSKQFLNVAVYLSIFKLTEQNKAWLGCKNKKMLRKPSLMLCSTEMLQDGMNVQIHLAIYFFANQLLKKYPWPPKLKEICMGVFLNPGPEQSLFRLVLSSLFGSQWLHFVSKNCPLPFPNAVASKRILCTKKQLHTNLMDRYFDLSND